MSHIEIRNDSEIYFENGKPLYLRYFDGEIRYINKVENGIFGFGIFKRGK